MKTDQQPILLLMSSYPNRECGIATFTNDLVNALKQCYLNQYDVRVCAIENGKSTFKYDQDVIFTLNAIDQRDYKNLAERINQEKRITHILIQHEFGLFGGDYGNWLKIFIRKLDCPYSIVFHTMLPEPDLKRYRLVRFLAKNAQDCIVMTNHAKDLMRSSYQLSGQSISVIPHGTHPLNGDETAIFKENNDLTDKTVLSTFGLLSSNKSIETALIALPSIIQEFPDVVYVILGKTHPEVNKHEGEKYRNYLERIVERLNLHNNVRFINQFLPTEELLKWLQITDVYLFTSRDPHQAVSGTFSYAMSSGCPIIATSIPHAKECLSSGAGRLIDFESSEQLAFHLNELLQNVNLRLTMRNQAFHYMKPTEWNNVALKYLKLLPCINEFKLQKLPPIRLTHLYHLMGKRGIYQFAQLGQPDSNSGYTLDDNARGLIACCEYLKFKNDPAVLLFIERFISYINLCQKENGVFLNYMNDDGSFSEKNETENLEDANGRAVWALGAVLESHTLLPKRIVEKAWRNLQCYLENFQSITSPRAIAFHIKGIHYLLDYTFNSSYLNLMEQLANQLKESFFSTKSGNWNWYEDQLTYANSTLPEAMALAYHRTKQPTFKTIAHMSFDFLLEHLFEEAHFQPISNNGWHHRSSKKKSTGGYQPIDVAYTILALDTFFLLFNDRKYLTKMIRAFQWFLGHNHLNQLVYNPETGGCHDGLEISNVNLNQGAESTICYLLARLTIEKHMQLQPNTNSSSFSRKEENVAQPVQPYQFPIV